MIPWRRCRLLLKWKAVLVLGLFWLAHLLLTWPSGLKRGPVVKRSVSSANGACVMPQLELWNSDVLQHFPKVYEPLICDPKEQPWTAVRNGTFLILTPDTSCTCTFVNRLTDEEYSENTVKCLNGSQILSDFISVLCSNSAGAKYYNRHAAIHVSDEAANRKVTGNQRLNVHMFGFDSISRLSAYRFLPKTMEFWTKELGAVVLEGYNIVGDGTPQALIPILTGKTEVELPRTQKQFLDSNYVNVYPFIWNQYRVKGYVTLFAEDAPSVGTFTYRLNGFKEQPTDHYMRTFYLMAEREATSMGSAGLSNCPGGKTSVQVFFEYAEQLFTAYPHRPKFAFSFHGGMTHGNPSTAGLADLDMLNHLKFFKNNGHLNDTVLIFMSDHGSRYGPYRQTYQGRMEERLPFFSFLVPDWFKTTYASQYKNLVSNSRLLTTPFDIHQVLLDLLEMGKGTEDERAMSLFQPVPLSRTCAEAAVEAHWCACLSWELCPVSLKEVSESAQAVVARINQETDPRRQFCSLLQLKKVKLARRLKANENMLKFKRSVDADGLVAEFGAKAIPVQEQEFQVTFQSSPGNMIYESTVRHQSASQISVDLADVSILTKYFDLPYCVSDENPSLRKWCVCKDKV